MAITISNFTKNIIVLTNDSLVNPALYTIKKMDDVGEFVEITNYPSTPTIIIAAGGTATIDLVSDGVYSITVDNSPSENIVYYFLLDFSIKTCGKKIMEEILCTTCSQIDICGKQAHYLKIEQLMKYNSIKNALYFLYNEIVQSQSIVDVIAADSAKLLMLSDLTKKLNLVCNNCNSDDICKNVYDSNNNSTGGCGCK